MQYKQFCSHFTQCAGMQCAGMQCAGIYGRMETSLQRYARKKPLQCDACDYTSFQNIQIGTHMYSNQPYEPTGHGTLCLIQGIQISPRIFFFCMLDIHYGLLSAIHDSICIPTNPQSFLFVILGIFHVLMERLCCLHGRLIRVYFLVITTSFKFISYLG